MKMYCICVHIQYAHAGFGCCRLMHLWSLHLSNKCVQQSFFFFYPAYTFGVHPCQQDVWVWERQGIYDAAQCMCASVRVSASGLRRFLLWCIRVCWGVSLLPVLVTWLLPVAGTTYKPAVIKVFDLLSLPAETHISRPANTALLPPWSMTEGEAGATNWQCRDWTRGCGDGEGWWQGWEERQRKSVKRKREWDRGEVRADENTLRNVHASCWAATFGKASKSHYLLLQSSYYKMLHFPRCSTQIPKQENKFLCCTNSFPTQIKCHNRENHILIKAAPKQLHAKKRCSIEKSVSPIYCNFLFKLHYSAKINKKSTWCASQALSIKLS